MKTNIKIISNYLDLYPCNLINYPKFRLNSIIPIIVFLLCSISSFGQRNDQYTGTAQTELKGFGFDVFNNKYYLQYTKNISYNAVVYILDPLTSNTGVKEQNPFSIIISSLDRDNNLEGKIRAQSASLELDPELGWDNLMLQWWTINLEGTTITGKLDYNHGELLGMNWLWAMDDFTQLVLPFDMNMNTLMDGTIRSDSIILNIQGQCSDKFLFSTIIKAGKIINVSNEPTFALQYQLNQNYPNPFHSSTRITFELPKKSDVTISIYNLKGERVAELLKGEMPIGKHSIPWNVNDQHLSSGIYLIKMETEDFVQIKKCNFIK